MKKISNILLFTLGILSIILTLSCVDIFEEDLEKETLTLVSPANGTVTTFSTQTFIWNKVDGADFYRLQIVNESFLQLNYFALDTNLSGNQFIYNLNPDKYEWRVTALNSAYETTSAIRTIEIDSTSDLIGQSILLSSPMNNAITNDSNLGFSWEPLYNANNYVFQLRENDFTGVLVYQDTLSATDVLKGSVILEEGDYGWGVKAINATSSTNYASRIVSTDYTPPSAPGIVTQDTSVQGGFTLRWNQISNDVNYDKIYFYDNQLLTNKVKEVEGSSPYSDSLPPKTYYWRVISVDKAGNSSDFSTSRRLEVRP